jgi:isopenicillin N synthase-like dioxygenase
VPPGMNDPEALAFCYADTIWPEAPDGFVDAWKGYYAALEDLAVRIMRVFATALGLPESYFDSFLDAPISALRALNYPEQHVAPMPGQIRAGAHTDYGSLTILLPQARSRGLEIITPDREWTPVPPIPGAFVINIGDRRRVAKGATRTGVSPWPSFTSRTGTRRSRCWTSALRMERRRNTSRCGPVPI